MRERVYEKYSTSSSNNAVPITVRQLEAIIRIAEALAKLTLSTQATYPFFPIFNHPIKSTF